MERVEIRRTVLDLTTLQLSRGTKGSSGAEESELQKETRDSWSPGQGRDDSASVCSERKANDSYQQHPHQEEEKKKP